MRSALWILTILLCVTISPSQTRRRSSAEKSAISEKTTDIRKVDFKNFTYRTKGESGPEYSFRLRNGKYAKEVAPQDLHSTRFESVVYGDLTNDGKDEAMVLLLETFGAGSAEQHVYIYTVKNGDVSKLTDFIGGTSGCVFEGEECSVLNVEIQEGVLIIDRAIPTDQDAKCCPSLHRSTRYRWDGSRLIEIGKTRIIRIADQNNPHTATPSRVSTVSGGVLNGKAISLPQPAYPAIAKAARASGTVVIQVTVDENGNVISASAVSGHPLLQGAAVAAARQAKLTPTKLSGQSVKVSGVLKYDFVPQ